MDPLSLAIGVALGVLGGWVVGRLGKANKLVDRILREETRLRHPSARVTADVDASQVPSPIMDQPRAMTESEYHDFVASWESRLSLAQSSVYGVNHAWRGQNPTTGIMEADEAAQPEVCGIWFAPDPAHLGDVQCQKTPDHEGRCDE